MYYYEKYSLDNIEYIDEDGNGCIEKWLPIVGYVGYYEVSDLGRIKSVLRKDNHNRTCKPVVLKQRFNVSGYLVTNLRRNGGLISPCIHKEVIKAFLPNPENKPEGNHKFGIKKDNRLSQLEWATKSENIKHSFDVLGKKIKNPMIGIFGVNNHSSKKVICINDGERHDSVRIAASFYNLKERCIAAVCRGENPSLFGLKFRYL